MRMSESQSRFSIAGLLLQHRTVVRLDPQSCDRGAEAQLEAAPSVELDTFVEETVRRVTKFEGVLVTRMLDPR